MRTPSKILIILMGSVGDVARGLLLAPLLKQAYPSAHLSWLVEPRCKELVRACGYIDKVIVFQRDEGFGAIGKLRKELSVGKFDLTLDLQRHIKSGFFSLLSRAKRRIGFHPRNAKEFNWIFNTEFIDYSSDEIPKYKHYVKFLDKLGIKEISYVEPIERPAAEHLPEPLRSEVGNYVVVSIGTNWSSKDWPVEGYKKLLDQLTASYPHSIILSGVESQKKNAEILSEGRRVINLVGTTTMSQLITLLSNARLVIGSDSGPGHIAALFGVKQVTLFGPTPSKRNVPFGSESLVVRTELGCAPCLMKKCPGMGKICMRLISPEMVMEQVEKALASSF